MLVQTSGILSYWKERSGGVACTCSVSEGREIRPGIVSRLWLEEFLLFSDQVDYCLVSPLCADGTVYIYFKNYLFLWLLTEFLIHALQVGVGLEICIVVLPNVLGKASACKRTCSSTAQHRVKSRTRTALNIGRQGGHQRS